MEGSYLEILHKQTFHVRLINRIHWPRLKLYQIVQFRIVTEERFVLLFLLMDEILNVNVKAGRSDTL